MIYKFRIQSQENQEFVREIEIDGEQTFLDLHHSIQESTHYDSSQMASFYILDANGERTQEIALFEMSSEEEELDVVVMDVAMIREFVSKRNSSLSYVFDFFSDRYFQIKLMGTYPPIPGVKYPFCSLSEQEAPQQIVVNAEDFEADEIYTNPVDKSKDDDFLQDFDEQIDEGPQFENLDDFQDLL